MPTSGAITFAMTESDMINTAAKELGVLPIGGALTATEYGEARTRLNSMLKSWQMQGVNLWREDEQSVTVVANTTPTTLASNVRQVFSARFIGTDYERVLGQWEREDYLSLPNKDTTGDPTIFYVKRERDALKMYVWPVPTANSTIKIDCERIVEASSDPAHDIDVPQHAYEAVWVNLAARLIPVFGVARVSQETAQFVAGRAQQLFQMLMDDDRPQSVFIGAG